MARFITGNTGIGTGAHLDFRVQDVETGEWVHPSSYRGMLHVGGKPLASQFQLTSPHGPRSAPTAGASTFHRGEDWGTPEGTEVEVRGAQYVRTWEDNNGGGVVSDYEFTNPTNKRRMRMRLLHGSKANLGRPPGKSGESPTPAASDTTTGDAPAPAAAPRTGIDALSAQAQQMLLDSMKPRPRPALAGQSQGLAGLASGFDRPMSSPYTTALQGALGATGSRMPQQNRSSARPSLMELAGYGDREEFRPIDRGALNGLRGPKPQASPYDALAGLL